MIDVRWKKPLRVTRDESAGPFLKVVVSQLDDVRRVLDRHGIRYWVDEQYVSFNGGPLTTVINFGRNGNADAIQGYLDSAA